MAGKKYKKALQQLDRSKTYLLPDAVNVVQQLPKAGFDETVELSMHLNVDPRQSDQMIRGTVPLPHGSGKNVVVVVFAKAGPEAEAAKEAGAEHVGFDELIKKCTGGWTGFDVAIATPAAMSEVRKLGKILGPRGLMPNPKTGTVTTDTAKAVQEVKAGRVEFKVDKGANIHIAVGKASFAAEKLVENAMTAIEAIYKSRPSSVKGGFVKSCTVSKTMSPSVYLDLKTLMNAA